MRADEPELNQAQKLFDERHFERSLEKVEQLLPKSSAAERYKLQLLLADLLVQLHRSEEARPIIEAIDPRNAPARFFRLRGQWQLQVKELDLARKDFAQALKSKPSPAEELRVLAAQLTLLAEEKKFDEADRLWAQALFRADELSADAWLMLDLFDSRYACLKHAGRRYDALSSCRLARALFQQQKFAEGVADSWIGEAEILHLLDDMPAAEKAALRAIELSPDKATALLFWGYSIVWEKHPPEHFRAVIELADRNWNQRWSSFEKFHVRLLQGLLYYYALHQYEPALNKLRQAEEFAGTTVRPSSGNSTILLSFNQFSDGYTSDMDKVLWLQLACLQELGRDDALIAGFMEEKLDQLPKTERAPWLYKLGQREFSRRPQHGMELFQQALKLATPEVRPRMLRAVAGVYHRLGYDLKAVKLGAELVALLPSMSGEKLAELERFELYQEVHEMIREQAWSAWRGEEFGAQPSVLLEYLAHDNESKEKLDTFRQQRFEDARRRGADSQMENAYTLRATALLYQGRLAEALALIRQADALAQRGNFRVASYRRMEAAIFSALGDYDSALKAIRSFDRAFEATDRSETVRTLVIEATALVKAGKYSEVLQLIPDQGDDTPPEAPQYQAAYEGLRVQALMGLNRWDEALAACRQLQDKYFDPGVKIQAGLLLAELAHRAGRKEQALEQLRIDLQQARSLGSVFTASVTKLWSEIDPATAPLKEAGEFLQEFLAACPAEVAEKYRRQPDIAALTRESVSADAPLTAKQFVAQLSLLSRSQPEFEVSVPLLPSAFVEQAALLPPRTALVQYYTGETSSLIMAASGDKFFLIPVGVGQSNFEALIARLRQGGQDSASLLGRLLMEPLMKVTDSRDFTFCTHGALQALSWDLLEVDGKALPDLLAWHYWVGSRANRSRTDFKAARVLALGGVSGAGLPGTNREVEFLKRLAPRRVSLLQGPSASRAGLKRALPDKDLVVIASHSDPKGITLSDGQLDLADIYGLPMKSGALVVLSSCQSGSIGSAERAPVSLATAFLDAGAGAVLATLDEVDDKQAEAFLTVFYAHLNEGKSPRECLRLAKLSAIARGGGTDWAKFVLFGGVRAGL